MNPPYRQVYAACQEGDVEALQRGFPDGPLGWRSSRGESLLHWVVETPHVPVLDWLLTFPAHINEPTDTGYTPLMWACYCRQPAMVRRLLAHGANLQATDPKGKTALHYACSREWVGGVALLLEQGADPDIRDRDGLLPEDEPPLFGGSKSPALRDLLEAARQGCGLK
jgi:uncharacterized protein